MPILGRYGPRNDGDHASQHPRRGRAVYNTGRWTRTFGRPYAFRERLVVSCLPDEDGNRPCRAVVGLSVGDLRRFLARIGPKNGPPEDLSRERGLARQDRIVRRKGKVHRARHGAARRAATGCFGQQRPWTELRGGARCSGAVILERLRGAFLLIAGFRDLN